LLGKREKGKPVRFGVTERKTKRWDCRKRMYFYEKGEEKKDGKKPPPKKSRRSFLQRKKKTTTFILEREKKGRKGEAALYLNPARRTQID